MMPSFTDREADRPRYGERIWTPVEAYDLVAPVYDQWHWREFWSRNEKPLIEEVLQRKTGTPTLSIDLGCGSGEYARVLEKLSPVLAIDPSWGMLRQAATRVSSATLLVQAPARSLPVQSATVDLAIAARSLSHERDLVAALGEMARVSRPGALVIISDVHAEHRYSYTRIPLGGKDVYIETFKRSPDEIRHVITRSGAWDIESEQTLGWDDLAWQPTDAKFFRIDKAGRRPVFFMVQLRRRR